MIQFLNQKYNYELKHYNIRLLAYIGDAIYELLTREYYFNNDIKHHFIHDKTTNIVNANFQALAYDNILDILNDYELNFIKKAKNFKNKNVAKKIKISVYAKATALEALFGYFYINNQIKRMQDIYKSIIKISENR